MSNLAEEEKVSAPKRNMGANSMVARGSTYASNKSDIGFTKDNGGSLSLEEAMSVGGILDTQRVGNEHHLKKFTDRLATLPIGYIAGKAYSIQLSDFEILAEGLETNYTPDQLLKYMRLQFGIMFPNMRENLERMILNTGLLGAGGGQIIISIAQWVKTCKEEFVLRSNKEDLRLEIELFEGFFVAQYKIHGNIYQKNQINDEKNFNLTEIKPEIRVKLKAGETGNLPAHFEEDSRIAEVKKFENITTYVTTTVDAIIMSDAQFADLIPFRQKLAIAFTLGIKCLNLFAQDIYVSTAFAKDALLSPNWSAITQNIQMGGGLSYKGFYDFGGELATSTDIDPKKKAVPCIMFLFMMTSRFEDLTTLVGESYLQELLKVAYTALFYSSIMRNEQQGSIAIDTISRFLASLGQSLKDKTNKAAYLAWKKNAQSYIGKSVWLKSGMNTAEVAQLMDTLEKAVVGAELKEEAINLAAQTFKIPEIKKVEPATKDTTLKVAFKDYYFKEIKPGSIKSAKKILQTIVAKDYVLLTGKILDEMMAKNYVKWEALKVNFENYKTLKTVLLCPCAVETVKILGANYGKLANQHVLSSTAAKRPMAFALIAHLYSAKLGNDYTIMLASPNNIKPAVSCSCDGDSTAPDLAKMLKAVGLKFFDVNSAETTSVEAVKYFEVKLD